MQKTLKRPHGRGKDKLKVNEPIATTAPRKETGHTPPKPIYALAAYTVEKRGKKWHVIKTAEHSAGKNTWRGPYATLNQATTAIARLLELEVSERHKRRCEWYGVAD